MGDDRRDLPHRPARLKWLDLGDGERVAVVPDVDECTARYVLDSGNGQPTSIHRTTAPPEPLRIAFRVVRSCPCCDRQLVITRYEDERTTVEPFIEDTS
jgi:hypothetical protein